MTFFDSSTRATIAGAGVALLLTGSTLRGQVSLAEALDTPGFAWTTSAENPFVGIQTPDARQDGDLARGAIFPNGDIRFDFESGTKIWMQTTIDP